MRRCLCLRSSPAGEWICPWGFLVAAPGGAAILERVVLATSARSWWLLPAPSAPMIPIERLELAQGSPILSDGAMRSPGSNVSERPLIPNESPFASWRVRRAHTAPDRPGAVWPSLLYAPWGGYGRA